MKSFLQHLSETHCSCGQTPCPHTPNRVPDSEDIEMSEVKKIEQANTKDMKELPGAKGEAAHNKLHSVIKGFIQTMKRMHD